MQTGKVHGGRLFWFCLGLTLLQNNIQLCTFSTRSPTTLYELYPKETIVKWRLTWLFGSPAKQLRFERTNCLEQRFTNTVTLRVLGGYIFVFNPLRSHSIPVFSWRLNLIKILTYTHSMFPRRFT